MHTSVLFFFSTLYVSLGREVGEAVGTTVVEGDIMVEGDKVTEGDGMVVGDVATEGVTVVLEDAVTDDVVFTAVPAKCVCSDGQSYRGAKQH